MQFKKSSWLFCNLSSNHIYKIKKHFISEVLFTKSGRQDSNLRPPGPKPGALPACATSRSCYRVANVSVLTIR